MAAALPPGRWGLAQRQWPALHLRGEGCAAESFRSKRARSLVENPEQSLPDCRAWWQGKQRLKLQRCIAAARAKAVEGSACAEVTCAAQVQETFVSTLGVERAIILGKRREGRDGNDFELEAMAVEGVFDMLWQRVRWAQPARSLSQTSMRVKPAQYRSPFVTFLLIGRLAFTPKFLLIGRLAFTPKLLLIGRLAFTPKFFLGDDGEQLWKGHAPCEPMGASTRGARSGFERWGKAKVDVGSLPNEQLLVEELEAVAVGVLHVKHELGVVLRSGVPPSWSTS